MNGKNQAVGAPAWASALGAWALAVALLAAPAFADEPAEPTEQPDANALNLPDDLERAPYREQRVGGRLESVIITRENGFTEIYRNNRADSIWTSHENELGEIPNMRQWIIRTW